MSPLSAQGRPLRHRSNYDSYVGVEQSWQSREGLATGKMPQSGLPTNRPFTSLLLAAIL